MGERAILVAFAKRAVGRLSHSVSAAIFIGVMSGLALLPVAFELINGNPDVRLWIFAAFAAGALVGAIRWARFASSRSTQEEQQRLQAAIAATTPATIAATGPAEPPAGLLDFATTQINGMAAREKLTMLKAERDANRLTALGTLLTVVSVFAPLAATYLYTSMEPLPATTVAGLVRLRQEIGSAPSWENVTIARDWHVLAGGLSLGFLFLAAARGVLRLESRNRAAALMLSRRVSHYERLVGILHVRAKVAGETDRMLAQVVSDVLTAVEKPPDIDQLGAEADETSNAVKEHITAIAELFKKQGAKT
jgi:hypothetical protein